MGSFDIDCLISGNTLCDNKWHVDEKGAVYHRLYYIYEGETIYKDNEQEIKLKKNNLYLFPIQRQYSISHNPGHPLRCLWFHILITPYIMDSVIAINLEDEPAVFHTIKALESILDGTGGNSEILTHFLNSLIMLLDSKFNFSISYDKRLAMVLRHIHNNYCGQIKNSTLSMVAGLDMYYFIRLFRKTFGVTPQEYISDYRFRKAFVLLQKGMLVEDVSEKLGFQDSKAFSRGFKKCIGISPSKCKGSQYLQP